MRKLKNASGQSPNLHACQWGPEYPATVVAWPPGLETCAARRALSRALKMTIMSLERSMQSWNFLLPYLELLCAAGIALLGFSSAMNKRLPQHESGTDR